MRNLAVGLAVALALALPAGRVAPVIADPGPGDPASALCVKNGATLASETLPNGTRHVVCVFPNGSRVDAAAYFRNKHRTR